MNSTEHGAIGSVEARMSAAETGLANVQAGVNELKGLVSAFSAKLDAMSRPNYPILLGLATVLIGIAGMAGGLVVLSQSSAIGPVSVALENAKEALRDHVSKIGHPETVASLERMDEKFDRAFVGIANNTGEIKNLDLVLQREMADKDARIDERVDSLDNRLQNEFQKQVSLLADRVNILSSRIDDFKEQSIPLASAHEERIKALERAAGG